MIKKFFFITFSTLIPLSSVSLQALTCKKAEEFFNTWIEWQSTVVSQSIAQQYKTIINQLNENWTTHSRETLEKNHSAFIKKLIGQQDGLQVNDHVTSQLKKLYKSAQLDMPTFVQTLRKLSLSVCQNSTETNFQEYIDANIPLIRFIFGQENTLDDNPLLFSVANNFFNYCFNPKTNASFKAMFEEPNDHPILRLLYTGIWHNLAGIGWKNWSSESLNKVKKAALKGKKVVYIAGGSDIYQLINSDIYNITVIDPQLPSQKSYYTNDWAWLINGEIGDQIIFETKGITMTRSHHQEHGNPFTIETSDKTTLSINPSVTEWTITDKAGKNLGSCVFDRRFVQQTDFQGHKNQTLLMSFNELFFVSAPDHLDGWHIDPNKFSKNTKLFIKQLHKPVTKKMICNMREAAILNSEKLSFINLGSCIN